jgi:hypothetical protein
MFIEQSLRADIGQYLGFGFVMMPTIPQLRIEHCCNRFRARILCLWSTANFISLCSIIHCSLFQTESQISVSPWYLSPVVQNSTTDVADSSKVYLRKKFNVLITTGTGRQGWCVLIAKNWTYEDGQTWKREDHMVLKTCPLVLPMAERHTHTDGCGDIIRLEVLLL